MKYGRAIRVARAARELSQEELAHRARLDPSYISVLESGGRVPSGAALEAIAKALRVPLYVLTLLASEKKDLRRVPAREAQLLGRHLLGVLIGSTKARKR